MANPYVKVGPFNEDAPPPLSPANLNQLDQGIHDAHFSPSCGVARSNPQSCGSGADVVVSFDLERWDQDGLGTSLMYVFSVQPTRVIAQVPGIYLMTGDVTWAANPANSRLQFFLNGATVLPGVAQTIADARSMSSVTQYPLSANDYIQLRVQQNSGGPMNLAVANFAMSRVG